MLLGYSAYAHPFTAHMIK